ncbi:cation:proton antiporter [Candidatus Zixiibacteriota bacterium]
METTVYLRDIVIILALAVIIVATFHKFKLPAIAGFILAGILAGPKGFSLVNDVHQVELLAEIGVALLLFGIGLELSLAKLRRVWKLALAGGFLQVGLSIAAAFVVAKLVNLPTNTAVFIGFLIALSSTAIVLRGLQQRAEVDTPHGRLILGILVFQDFSVVPMILSLPLLAGAAAPDQGMTVALVRSIVIIGAVVLVALFVIPRLLRVVARTRQRHLFILTVFLLCMGTAWVITSSGASLAIGAFLAGLVVAGSEYRHQAMADLISFREVFASLFFVSVGMMLAPRVIFDNLPIIMLLLVAILFGKAAVIFVVSLIMRTPQRVALLAAVALAQVGEFSLVLFYAAGEFDLIDKHVADNLLAAVILSMFLTPFAIAFGPRLASGAGRWHGLTRLFRVATTEEAVGVVRTMQDHVIIGGYGFAGRELAAVLANCTIPYVIVDLNVENVNQAGNDGHHAFFGDVTSPEVLEYLGITHARELVLLINDPGAVEYAITAARRLAAGLHIIVRTNYLLDLKPLRAAGADEVIPAEREAAVQVISGLLERYQMDPGRIATACSQVRNHLEEETV